MVFGGKRISDLDVDVHLSGNEIVPLVDGSTKRTTVAAIAALADPSLSADLPAPADLWVSSVSGDNENDGSEEAPLATLGEARKRIGDRDGPCVIHLLDGTTYNIGTDDGSRYWGRPRKGWGRIEIRGEEVIEEVTLTVLSATYLGQIGAMLYEVDADISAEAYDHLFAQRGVEGRLDNNSGVVVRSAGSYVVVRNQNGYDLGMPDPATITLWRPATLLNVNSPETLRCGFAEDVSGFATSGSENSLGLTNLTVVASAIQDGTLRSQWCRYSGTTLFHDVSFDCSVLPPNAFMGSAYFEGCATSNNLMVATFNTPTFSHCGKKSLNGSAAFKAVGRLYVADVYDSQFEFNGICTGDILNNVRGSRVFIGAMPIDYRGIDEITSSTVGLTIFTAPPEVAFSSGLAWVHVGQDSEFSVTFDGTPNEIPWGFFLSAGAKLKAYQDLGDNVVYPGTSGFGDIIVPFAAGDRAVVNGAYVEWG